MFVKSVNVLPASIKSMNPMQKYSHITELFACTQKMLAIMILFPISFLISSYSNQKHIQHIHIHIQHQNY